MSNAASTSSAPMSNAGPEPFEVSLKQALGLRGKALDGADLNNNYIRRFSAAVDSSIFMATDMAKAKHYDNSLNLLTEGMKLRSIPGMILEFGVFSGRTINHLASLDKQKIFGFDSFEGLPEDWRTDFKKGKFARDLPRVSENVELVVGWFDNTLPEFLSNNKDDVSFLHVDCDLYSSTKCIFQNCRDRIREGTVIVFDEYFNYVGWREHEHKALQEFLKDTGFQFEWFGVVPSHQQAAGIIRRG